MEPDMNKYLLAACATAAMGATAYAQSSTNLRNPSVNARGDEACVEWNLSGSDLTECRRAWMDAKTDADRLKVRQRYEGRPAAQATRPTNKTLAPEETDATSMCDHWNLKTADLSECRAQVKAAKNQGDFARIEERYAPGQRRPEGSRVKSSGPVGKTPTRTPD
jgi:hypothetical protein